MTLILKTVLCALSVLSVGAYVETHFPSHNNALDLKLFEEVIDLEQCDKQLEYIVSENSALMYAFIDTSAKIPRNILKGNTRDLGSYFPCLEISYQTRDMDIRGKYSVVRIPLQQDDFELPSLPELPELPNITWPELPWPEWNPDTTHYTGELLSKLEHFEKLKHGLQVLHGANPRVAEDSAFPALHLELAYCIPRVCTPRHAFDVLTSNLTATLEMEEVFARLPNDKTWVAADTVAVVLFSIIGVITMLSTSYDVMHRFIQKRDPKKLNKNLTLFSVYTNTKNFFVFHTSPSSITCLDGIRSFAMMWVIVGHTYVTQFTYIPENPLDMFNFMRSFWGLWITSGNITVDTFFMIGGLLLVYTTAAKVSRMSLLKKLHLFYLNRLFRMFPVLAAVVLIQASFLHRSADGPYWTMNSEVVNNCRANWWSTLLFVQNWVTPEYMCLSHTWYLAIDFQLYVASPLVLFWILGNNTRSAWIAMTAALVASLSGATVYNFINEFQSTIITLSRPNADTRFYLQYYYIHPLNRISPFVIGMMIGYVLHLYRGKAVRMSWVLSCFLWFVALVASFLVVLTTYFNIQPDWDNQLADNIINSTIRPAWAASVGWLVFACHHGYGGPVNWVLSWDIFKILGRLSYAMYIIHYQIMFLLNATTLQPIYFASDLSMQRFCTFFLLTVIGAFLLTITIDYPCASIVKILLGGGPRRPPKVVPSAPKDPDMAFKAVEVIDNIQDSDMKKTRM